MSQSIALPSGDLELLQPEESAELPDAGEVEWAPIAPYWSVLWRSGVALARELDTVGFAGRRVVELGCGLAAPSLAAARAGASVLATDASAEAVALVGRNALINDVPVETATVDWTEPDALIRLAPFDVVLAADVLYDRAAVPPLLSLLPPLAPEVWLADPGRPAAGVFLEQAGRRWEVETRVRGVVRVHRMRPRQRSRGGGRDNQARMSPANVELTRQAVDALNRHDLDALLTLVDPAVDFADLIVELEGGGSFHGHGGIRSWWEGYLAVFPNLSVEIEEVRDFGTVTYARGRVRGHGSESDASFEQSFHTLGEWGDGKLTWSRSFRSEADAVEAAAVRSSA